MFHKGKTMTKALASVFALAGVLVVTSFPRTAHATSNVSGPVTQVEYNAGNSSVPQLMIQLNGVGNVNYFGQQPTPGCSVPSLSADTVKIFHSQAQAALLSGKNVIVYFNVCNGFNYISDIVLH